MSDVLEKICADKRIHVEQCKESKPEKELLKSVARLTPPRGFINNIRKKIAEGGIGLIAEVKKASPSKGVIREDFDPVAIAKIYEGAGAACISVLTDEKYFQGRDEYLTAVRNSVKLPVLRKDFMIDPYQVTEARVLGADCILIIMAAVSDELAGELEAKAEQMGMDVLVEVHDEAEVHRALKLKSRLIGINNRNLKTLEVNLSTTEVLSRLIPSDYQIVCESGITSHKEIQKISALGVKAYLVGESLIKEKDIKSATLRLQGKIE